MVGEGRGGRSEVCMMMMVLDANTLTGCGYDVAGVRVIMIMQCTRCPVLHALRGAGGNASIFFIIIASTTISSTMIIATSKSSSTDTVSRCLDEVCRARPCRAKGAGRFNDE